jgi:uracil-DNA glycosylase
MRGCRLQRNTPSYVDRRKAPRGVHEPTGIDVVATYHPSAVLRVPDAPAREALRGQLLEDLERARRLASARRSRRE